MKIVFQRKPRRLLLLHATHAYFNVMTDRWLGGISYSKFRHRRRDQALRANSVPTICPFFHRLNSCVSSTRRRLFSSQRCLAMVDFSSTCVALAETFKRISHERLVRAGCSIAQYACTAIRARFVAARRAFRARYFLRISGNDIVLRFPTDAVYVHVAAVLHYINRCGMGVSLLSIRGERRYNSCTYARCP